jgi:hypothetical protein
MFFTLMVGAPGPSAPSPREAAVDIFCVDGGRSWSFGVASQGLTVDIFYVDGGCSRNSGTIFQGACRQCFLH